mmetsp:Transcript_85481/g.169620  ORF Transcript_85481/g.169620 Transcript_85481/m.169620 type:complete len:438 (+) Transcript_85481:81-1394(+)|eukprot:CAMPEP_0172667868 /NCGR_PEP_ID=MMETSP1074-20121228/8701_1 /TAXON_ID=2916 /ORGANISM="Ceratium fusus, Strain PA161109" /LENGTH=437 /DNA_ID=CAMNT_0013484439 /DNA_START=71 /DNA_END=1384 /DNA_ORIENTATION=+
MTLAGLMVQEEDVMPVGASAGQRRAPDTSRRAAGGRRGRLVGQQKQRSRRPDACDGQVQTRLPVEGVLKTMCASVGLPRVQEKGCKALFELASNSEIQGKLGFLGGIEAVVRAMEAHGKVTELLVMGTSALNRMCERHESNTQRLVSVGGIRVMAEAMKRHRLCQNLQEAGCRAMKNAAACNAECQLKVSSIGGIEAVLAAMTAHTESAAVQEAGCQALKELAVHNGHIQDQIVSNGGIQVVLRAMEMHGQLISIQVWGCGVLRNITACNADHQEGVISRGGIQTVLDAMSTHLESVDVQWAGCWALFCIAVHNPVAAEEVVAYGTVQSAIRAMQHHRREPRVQEAGCWVLKELAKHIARDDVQLAAAVHAVTKAMEKNPSSVPVQTAVSGALRKFAVHDQKGWVKTMCLGRCGRFGASVTKQMLSSIKEGNSDEER